MPLYPLLSRSRTPAENGTGHIHGNTPPSGKQQCFQKSSAPGSMNHRRHGESGCRTHRQFLRVQGVPPPVTVPLSRLWNPGFPLRRKNTRTPAEFQNPRRMCKWGPGRGTANALKADSSPLGPLDCFFMRWKCFSSAAANRTASNPKGRGASGASTGASRGHPSDAPDFFFCA